MVYLARPVDGLGINRNSLRGPLAAREDDRRFGAAGERADEDGAVRWRDEIAVHRVDGERRNGLADVRELGRSVDAPAERALFDLAEARPEEHARPIDRDPRRGRVL